MTAISGIPFQRPKWQTVAVFTLAFWLSSSLILDVVIMPGLYATGMMNTADFAIAGYSIFWAFNRIEILSAALLLTSVLILGQTQLSSGKTRRLVLASTLLLCIALIYTYGLTPAMSQLGLDLSLFSPEVEVPAAMNQMHGSYFGLEVIKLLAGGLLLGQLYGDRATTI